MSRFAFKLTPPALLKASLFATGLAGIVSEYVLSTLATYFLGNSVFQWTITVSLMLFAMGLGARLSRYLHARLISAFIILEIILSLFIALLTVIIYTLMLMQVPLAVFLYAMAVLLGTLIGLEIPLAMRINEDYEELRVNVANVLEKDYWGALLGGALFAFILLPFVGLETIPVWLAGINFVVATMLFFGFYQRVMDERRWLIYAFPTVLIVLSGAGLFVTDIASFAEQSRFRDRIIFSQQTAYQKIVLTEFAGDYWLYLNGNEQFSSVDEDRYHEVMVHMPLLLRRQVPQKVLILGGGDGLAARELVKYKSLKRLVVVDLDPAMTGLALNHPVMLALNDSAFHDNRVSLINTDAWTYIDSCKAYYDLIICDFPDPRSAELSRLYSREFYELCRHRLRADGQLVTQAGSPFFAPRAFAAIGKTLAAVFREVRFMQVNMPTLGDWGFVIAGKKLAALPQRVALPVATRFIDEAGWQRFFLFNKGERPDTANVEINRLRRPILERYYRDSNWEFF
jgi:spermidine synthase